MIPASVPSNEQERLNTLKSLQILDTTPSAQLDRLTRLVAKTFNVPVALITLIDHDRQINKSRFGVSIAEIPRCTSICSHTILARTPLVVTDLRTDPRFYNLPSVINDPYFVFYAGYQIHSRQGFALGTLCILDSKSHDFGADQQSQLIDFAKIAEDYFHHLENTATTDTKKPLSDNTLSMLKQLCQDTHADLHAPTFREKNASLSTPTNVMADDFSSNKLQNITDNIPALISGANNEMHYTFTNKTYEEWFGIPYQEISGMAMPDVIGQKSFQITQKYAQRAIKGQKVSFENTLSTLHGRKHVQTTLIPTNQGNKKEFYILSMDITKLKKLHNRLIFEASHDTLTGLPNRRSFIKSLNQTLKKPETYTWIALFFLDLDGFKSLNDRFGHKFGDEVLKMVAQQIRRCIRSNDVIARLAGDEFTILLRHTENPYDAVSTICHRLHQKLDDIKQINQIPLNLSASIGAVIVKNDKTLMSESLVSEADKAMYQAKALGKNQFYIKT